MTKIPYGESRDIVVAVPRDHGQVTAEFRYRDWWTIRDQDVVVGSIVKGSGEDDRCLK